MQIKIPAKFMLLLLLAVFFFMVLYLLPGKVSAQCNAGKGESWCWQCNECMGPENLPKTCPNCGGGGEPEPVPCSCVAPNFILTITSPADDQTELNPDQLTVSWKIDPSFNRQGQPRPIRWGVDNGYEPSCSNNASNDRFRIYYRKISGGVIDLPPSSPPYTRIQSGWYRLDLPTSTYTYNLYNLDGGSAYEIYVAAFNGCTQIVSGTITVATALRPKPPVPPKQNAPWLLTYGNNAHARGYLPIIPQTAIDSILINGSGQVIAKTSGQSFLSTYIVSSIGTIVPTRASMNLFLNLNYNDLNIQPPFTSEKESYYDYLLETAQANVTLKTLLPAAFSGKTSTSSTGGVASGTAAHFLISGDVVIQDPVAPRVFTCDTQSVFFIDGTLTIDPDLLASGNDNGCIFVVRGNIRITSGDFKNAGNNNPSALVRYDEIDGFFVTDGSFITYSEVLGNGKWDGLVVKGSVIAKTPSFSRDLDEDYNLKQPGEAIVFDARYTAIKALRDALEINEFSIREEGFNK